MNKTDIDGFFSTLQQQNPQPKTELAYTTPFELLIAVLLSAQTTDIAVNKATKTLFACANTPHMLLDLGVLAIESHIKSIGLFHSKAKHIVQTCQILIDQHQSVVPHNRIDLEKLPGVGRKTANVVLNTAFGQPTMAVDTHVFRVSNRTGLAKGVQGKTISSVEKTLLTRIPKNFLMDAHHWLILHGRYVCKAKTPNCITCVVAAFCDTGKKYHKIHPNH